MTSTDSASDPEADVMPRPATTLATVRTTRMTTVSATAPPTTRVRRALVSGLSSESARRRKIAHSVAPITATYTVAQIPKNHHVNQAISPACGPAGLSAD